MPNTQKLKTGFVMNWVNFHRSSEISTDCQSWNSERDRDGLSAKQVTEKLSRRNQCHPLHMNQ